VLTTSPTASSLNSGEYSLRLLARLNILSWKGATKRGQGQKSRFGWRHATFSYPQG
jgi:hypothetical protein